MKKVLIFLHVAVVLVVLIGTTLNVQAQKKKGQQEQNQVTTVSLSSSYETLILGKWKLDADHLKDIIKKEADKVRSTNPEKANEIENSGEMFVFMLSSMTIEFKKGGELEMSVAGNSEKGSWRLEDNGKTLVQKGKEDEIKSRIIELTDKKLVLETGEGEDKMQLQFIK